MENANVVAFYTLYISILIGFGIFSLKSKLTIMQTVVIFFTISVGTLFISAFIQADTNINKEVPLTVETKDSSNKE